VRNVRNARNRTNIAVNAGQLKEISLFEVESTRTKMELLQFLAEILISLPSYTESEMFDENAFRRHAAETLDLLASLQQFRSLFKTEGGYLTQAGKATVLQGLKSGMSPNEIADLLEVSPAVVRYHWKQHAETRRADPAQAA
jgi:hypothetical protein